MRVESRRKCKGREWREGQRNALCRGGPDTGTYTVEG